MTPSLSNRMDRDVYQVLKRLEETVNEGRPFKTSTQAYDAVKKSNSSLSRQKKRPLLDAIDRAMQVRRAELEDSEDSEAALEAQEAARSPPPETGGFLLNRQLTKNWNVKPASMPSREERPAKRQRAQDSGDEQEGRRSGNEAPPSKSRVNGAVTDDGEDKATRDAAPVQKKVKKINRFQVDHQPKHQALGGLADVQDSLYHKLHTILRRPEVWTQVWAEVQGHQTQGMLISGPMGIGKRSLVRSLAARLEVPIVSLDQCFDDPERMDKSLTDAFDEAMRLAPSIILIEDIDHHASKPGSAVHTEHHTRAVNLLRRHMLRMHQTTTVDRRVHAVATTSNLADLSPQLLTYHLFETTVHMRVPDGAAREDIFKVALDDAVKAEGIDYAQLSRLTHGFVGADIKMAVEQAADRAAMRAAKAYNTIDSNVLDHSSDSDDHAMLDTVAAPPETQVTMDDLHRVIKDFTPSLRKEGFTVIPSVSWDQVGALQKVREQMQMSIIGPIKHPDLYDSWGLNKPAGVLLWGPPGCGKTLVAQAVANEAQASFILINGPEILNKYVGESERAVREAFQRARSSTPCILFFDEIDSIAVSREGASTDSGSRIVATLLAELDGVNDRSGIYVIGTTNRPDKIDPAMLRPGRLSVRMFVDLPTEDERVDILRAIFRSNHPRASDAELTRLEAAARDPRCRGFSGADLQGLRIKAAEHGLQQWLLKHHGTGMHLKAGEKVEIEEENWEYALANTVPSVMKPEDFRALERSLGREA
jgi:ribosome biogenesis ATPase